jgi:hypothetical protein
VIVKFRDSSALLARHALKSTASPTDARATMAARAKSLGERIGFELSAGRGIR